MYSNIGYVYPGMVFISPEEARKQRKKGCIVYRLNDDNSESMLDKYEKIVDDKMYGYEVGEFDFKRYLENREVDGVVMFSKGQSSLNDLLMIATEWLIFSKNGDGLRQTQKDGADMVINRSNEARGLPEGSVAKRRTWELVVNYIDAIAPFGWKFGRYANNGEDYAFIKEAS